MVAEEAAEEDEEEEDEPFAWEGPAPLVPLCDRDLPLVDRARAALCRGESEEPLE